MPKRQGTALVLGGGGVTGVAWELGMLLGLSQAGLSLLEAALFIGTSAGSVVAVHAAAGADLATSFARQVEGPGQERAARFPRGVLGRMIWAMLRSRSAVELGQRVGRLALAASTVPEAERRKIIASRLPVSEWPEADLRITAVDTGTGELRVFTRADGVPLGDAVAASCAVPGVWPSVTIEGRRYMDGGMHSAANVYLAAGVPRVVVLAPMVVGFGILPAVRAQVDELRRSGSRVVVVSPSRAARRVMGRNALDPALRPAAARAGLSQSAEVIESVRGVWDG